MKKSLILLFLMSLIGCEKRYTAKIVYCHDGDTFWLANGKRIRLAFADSPELQQPFGPEAKAFSESMVLNKEVELKEICRDKYERYVANVIVDGKDLSELLLERGLAVAYRKYSPHSIYAKFEEARGQRRGLFAQSNYQTPYQYRHQNHKK